MSEESNSDGIFVRPTEKFNELFERISRAVEKKQMILVGFKTELRGGEYNIFEITKLPQRGVFGVTFAPREDKTKQVDIYVGGEGSEEQRMNINSDKGEVDFTDGRGQAIVASKISFRDISFTQIRALEDAYNTALEESVGSRG